MATYKKRGLKPRDRKDQQSLESQSATAEVFKTLDQTASKSEQWIDRKTRHFYLMVWLLLLLQYWVTWDITSTSLSQQKLRPPMN